MASSRIENPILFICDIQEKFRRPIHSFPSLISSTSKLLRATSHLSIPVLATTQYAAKLGSTVEELPLKNHPHFLGEFDKTAFSMMKVKGVLDAVGKVGGDKGRVTVLLTGLETHICVTQTALDLLSQGHGVYVLADAVSSCNVEERWVALDRLRAAGAIVTTTESVLYELVGDATAEPFKEVSKLVREFKEETKVALETFCPVNAGTKSSSGGFFGL